MNPQINYLNTAFKYCEKIKQNNEYQKRSCCVLAQACNPNTWEAEAGASWIWDQPGYLTKLCSPTRTKKSKLLIIYKYKSFIYQSTTNKSKILV